MSTKYTFIDDEKNNFPIVKMCTWLDVSTSGYYEWKDRPPSPAAQRRKRLAELITTIFKANHGTYGYRRIQPLWGAPAHGSPGAGLGGPAAAQDAGACCAAAGSGEAVDRRDAARGPERAAQSNATPPAGCWRGWSTSTATST